MSWDKLTRAIQIWKACCKAFKRDMTTSHEYTSALTLKTPVPECYTLHDSSTLLLRLPAASPRLCPVDGPRQAAGSVQKEQAIVMACALTTIRPRGQHAALGNGALFIPVKFTPMCVYCSAAPLC